MNMSVDAIDPRSRKTVAALITDRLCDDIQNGILRPGTRLVQMDLVQRFNVSRVAVRDALMDLRRRGLSVSVPLRGDIVRPISIKTVKDLFDLRRINESYAMSLACDKIEKKDIEKLEKIIQDQCNLLKEGNVAAFIDKDWDFHRTIFDLADNEPLRELIESLWARTRQARSVAQRNVSWAPTWQKASISRHKEIFKALAHRDRDFAVKLTEQTIQSACDELCRELLNSGWNEELQEARLGNGQMDQKSVN